MGKELYSVFNPGMHIYRGDMETSLGFLFYAGGYVVKDSIRKSDRRLTLSII